MQTQTKIRERSFYPTSHELTAAATGRLSLIVRPIVGIPDGIGIGECHWSRTGLSLAQDEKCLCMDWGCKYRVGDRLLFKEVWAEDFLDGVKIVQITKRMVDEMRLPPDDIGFIDWQPASTMPRGVVQFASTILGIKPVRIHSLTAKEWLKAGIQIQRDIDGACGEVESFQKAENAWNSFNPYRPWESNPWVWAIAVEPSTL